MVTIDAMATYRMVISVSCSNRYPTRPRTPAVGRKPNDVKGPAR